MPEGKQTGKEHNDKAKITILRALLMRCDMGLGMGEGTGDVGGIGRWDMRHASGLGDGTREKHDALVSRGFHGQGSLIRVTGQP